MTSRMMFGFNPRFYSFAVECFSVSNSKVKVQNELKCVFNPWIFAFTPFRSGINLSEPKTKF